MTYVQRLVLLDMQAFIHRGWYLKGILGPATLDANGLLYRIKCRSHSHRLCYEFREYPIPPAV